MRISGKRTRSGSVVTSAAALAHCVNVGSWAQQHGDNAAAAPPMTPFWRGNRVMSMPC
ncbi:hypothetical protein KCP74_06875 [Salmonella enterica subsp. enterica]|nr:hypothetical protein KCP74_06875 [Salmonella enterica subsp. enterica]